VKHLSSSRDASQYEGWFYEGAGIYRHVWLNEYNNLHIVNDGVFVSATVQNNSAVVNVETTIQNQGLSLQTAQSAPQLLTVMENHRKAPDQTVSLNANESRQ